MAKLALNIIAKDEINKIIQIIQKYGRYFDEICIAIDDVEIFDKCSKLNLEKTKFFKYEWRDDFSHKRNWLMQKTQSDYIFRLDTDDEIVNPELIRPAFKRYIGDDYTLIFMMYFYSFDASGNVNAKHWRETIVKNDGNLYWNKAIHENVLPKSTRRLKGGKENKIYLVHKATPEEFNNSTKRNLRYLLKEYQTTKDKPDPRTVGYIARMFFGLKKYKEAIPFFEKFLTTSGWDDDKYFAWIQLCDCYTSLGLYERALSCCVEAVLMNPYYPDAYFHLLSVYFEKKEYAKAIEWGRLGFSKKSPETMMVTYPTNYTWRPLATLATCYMALGKFQESFKLLNKAREIAPKEKSIEDTLRFLTEIYTDDQAVKSYLYLMKYNEGDLRKFRALIDSVPRNIAQDERILVTRNKIEPGKKWPSNSIVFFCGGAWEDWCDSSIIGGIGGSEEATIYLSREFTKLGYQVTIFNQCGELAGNYRGVEYKSFYEFNPKDDFNIVISWRQNIFGKKVMANKKIIWLHDIPFSDQFLPEDEDTYDKVIVLSQYHKSVLKGVPESKIFVSRNGLNMADYENVVETRNPRRIIWASSYDRGLEEMLRWVWPRVIKEIPDAELHIFYGWNTYDEMIKVGRRSPEFKVMMLELMKQKGVYEHGRIGHKKLIREYYKSGIWGYPTTFTEIHCIGALRAQVTGAIPVVNNYCALRETVQFGIKNEGSIRQEDTFINYAKQLIGLLNDPARQETIRKEMMDTTKQLYGWDKLALEWKNDLFS